MFLTSRILLELLVKNGSKLSALSIRSGNQIKVGKSLCFPVITFPLSWTSFVFSLYCASKDDKHRQGKNITCSNES